MIACDEATCRIAGAVTVDSVGNLLRALQPHLAKGVSTLDFGAVEAVDSAALALIFSAMRQASQAGRTLSCTGLPPSFTTLAELYGVADLLPA
ncbi:STAS domain-containing protein [Thiobacillus sedimenti]|uniref:STAS domain-containing protein n=1 Tax=Thiobacillus sedimenti TaxID=3110231 RepID=A0ABZ1CGQ2_9PROT|nr:STAS domain-containing protein [Thiobacillus sp. SCUT-2]WRS38422.1 STAS domain-containing protein [Thiobacillus sp. SCUT-2]